ncbi:hypothetical protein MUP77_15485 [Candidatus Bathyarchaeota archaeon]|nr:hypothetical protein [Candidatus Bathyarchaeota archaeon]
MNEFEKDKQDSFQEFAGQALRLTRKGSFEQLLAQHLIQSVPMDPMNKIRLILEASFMVPRDKLDMDSELAETVYLIALGFLNTSVEIDFVSMAWGFNLSDENFERFIKPWHSNIPLGFSSSCDAERDDKHEEVKAADSEAKRFFLLTHNLNLHPASFQCLKSEFLIWSIPIAMEIFEKLSRLIDPDLYKEMLQILRPEAKQA